MIKNIADIVTKEQEVLKLKMTIDNIRVRNEYLIFRSHTISQEKDLTTQRDAKLARRGWCSVELQQRIEDTGRSTKQSEGVMKQTLSKAMVYWEEMLRVFNIQPG